MPRYCFPYGVHNPSTDFPTCTYGRFTVHDNYVISVKVHPVTGEITIFDDLDQIANIGDTDEVIASIKQHVSDLPNNMVYHFTNTEIDLIGRFSLGDLYGGSDCHLTDNTYSCLIAVDHDDDTYEHRLSATLNINTGALTVTLDGRPVSAEDQTFFEDILGPMISGRRRAH